MAVERERPRIIDFYSEVVLPALAERLDQAFPEFGWRRDGRGWIATNEEHTHARLGVRAERVVAHGPAPRGFLVHGGDSMLWTAYVSGGQIPHGIDFIRAVTDLAGRAGVDRDPVARAPSHDRRAELLEDFFNLARRELSGERGAGARAYLERRGFPVDGVEDSGLGLVPAAERTREVLTNAGYAERELAASGLLGDSRWPGRLCGAWRDEWGRIGSIWTRSLEDSAGTRYLYLRGASRTDLPPYGFAARVRELTLVEGFFDFHQLRALGVQDIAALGGTATSPRLFERLDRLGVQEVLLCLDNDEAGRAATARAVEHASRALRSPSIHVVTGDWCDAKDPDELIRRHGLAGWKQLLQTRECGVVWRAAEFARGVGTAAPASLRRQALARAGMWLGSLPPRLALEQEDAVQVVARRCGYSPEAAARSFRARFWDDASLRGEGQPARSLPASPEL